MKMGGGGLKPAASAKAPAPPHLHAKVWARNEDLKII